MNLNTGFKLIAISSRRGLVGVVLLALALTLPPTQGARAAPHAYITVTNTNDSGVGSLRWAVGVATPGDTINFFLSGCPCTITLTSGEIVISKDIAIVGLGQAMLAISGNNSSRVFNITTTDPVSFSDVTITNGKAMGGNGGGVTTSSNALTVINITVSGNNSHEGGIYNNGTATIINSIFSGNTAGFAGGGIFNNGTATVINSTLSGNSVINGGGGISNSGIMTVTNSTLSGNSVINGNGGGISNSGIMTVTNSTLSGNSVTHVGGSFADGGGIFNTGTTTITNSTISGNSAIDFGGGIFNGGTTTITNSTISGNSAPNGGAIESSGSATLRNTILAYSPSGGNCFDPIVNGGNNIDDDGSCGWGSTNGSMSNVNPLLGPLANNGGPTQTMALLPGSPAFNGVTYNLPNGCPSTDQRGIARPQGARCDIGALESTLINIYRFPLMFR